jgi:hypothetical protein
MQSTTELLKKLDSLLEAFPRHYLAVQDRDAVAQMIQRDCWSHFQVEVARARQKIRCELETSGSSGAGGGKSTYQNGMLGLANVALPPETRITVNGKTFELKDINKEMLK